jgi:hypothetical protein
MLASGAGGGVHRNHTIASFWQSARDDNLLVL